MTGQDGSSVKLTYEDYCLIPDDLNRHEILDGEHFVNPAPGPGHQRALLVLAVQFEVQLPKGLVYIAPCDLHLTEVDVLQPDLMVLSPDRRPIVTEIKVEGPPNLVVEILSPSTASLDRDLKRARYARGGVPEYWIVDLDERVVEQFVFEGEGYRFLGAHPNAVVPRSLEGLRIDVSGLW